MYGFASGAIERTSMRADFSLPRGIRTIEPRSMADTLIWFGASKCGSSRRYEFTLEFRIRQMSLALARMRLMKLQPAAEIRSLPLASQKRFTPPRVSDRLVCMPLPFTPVTGFGRKLAVMSSCAATCRQMSL